MCQHPFAMMNTRLSCFLRADFNAFAVASPDVQDSSSVHRVARQLAQIGDALSDQYKKARPSHARRRTNALESLAIEVCIFMAFHILAHVH